MVGFLLQRVGYGLAVILTVTTLVFGLIHLGGDPVDGLGPPGASPEQQARIRERFGLDRPLPVQYAPISNGPCGGTSANRGGRGNRRWTRSWKGSRQRSA